jgi:hypothetical protein
VFSSEAEAAAPALGLDLYSVTPNTTLALDRVEAVRGPAGVLRNASELIRIRYRGARLRTSRQRGGRCPPLTGTPIKILRFRLRREDLYRRSNVNGLLTYRFDHDTALDLRGGYASLTSPLQSPIGTLQPSAFGATCGQLQEFVGAPKLGLMVMGRLTYELP